MSFYIEVENLNRAVPKKTFLVLSFNAASTEVCDGFFKGRHYEIDPNNVNVTLSELNGAPASQNLLVQIPVGYEEFKQKLLDARKNNTIPAFKIA